MTPEAAQAAPEQQRQELLATLFGPDIPSALDSQLLRTADVAALFQVSERTVSEWARRGRIPSVRTPGGHRRYPADEVRRLLDETGARVADGGVTAGVASNTGGPSETSAGGPSQTDTADPSDTGVRAETTGPHGDGPDSRP